MAKNGRKVKAIIALIFGRKVKAIIALLFARFSPLFRGQKREKSKAIALTFRPFLATYIIFEKVAKNEQKVRL